ncbi:MAG: NADH-quinone oxidoreductase subunit N [Myxococcota bacterium]
MSPWFVLLPLFVLAGGGLIVMLVDAFSKRDAQGRGPELPVLTAALLTIAGLSSLALWLFGGPAEVPELLDDYLAVDSMALFFDVVICGGGALSALLAGGYLAEHRFERGEFYVLLLFSAFGAMVLARATDLLTLFIGLETMSLGVYCMIAFRRTSSRAAEAAIKYFLLGSFAAAILLFGSALLYGATGHTRLAAIGTAVAGGDAILPVALMGLVLVLVGLAFKVSAVPFHMWTPDAYEGAPTPATTFMSVAVKAAAFAVLVRVLAVSFGDELSASVATGWPPVVAGLAALSMVVGNAAAVVQPSVKRMLAYSSIAHAGYALVAVAAMHAVGQEGVSAVLYYMMAYTVSNVLAFGSLILMGSYGKEAVTYEDLAGLGRRHPLAALPFVVGVLSLLGLPPTAGFFGKYYAFNAAVQADMVWLAVLGVLASAVGAYYYLRVIVFLFMREPRAGAPIAVPMRSGYVAAALVVSGYFVMKMGITPGTYLDWAIEAAQQLVS